jgi:S1-C subfamily serine protease
VLNGGEEVEPHMADYLLLSKEQELPAAGILGISLEEKNGESRIRSLNPKGAAEKARLKREDVLLEVDGQTIKRIADLHLALWDKKPGDRVRVSVRRKGHFGAATERSFEVELAAAVKP